MRNKVSNNKCYFKFKSKTKFIDRFGVQQSKIVYEIIIIIR